MKTFTKVAIFILVSFQAPTADSLNGRYDIPVEEEGLKPYASFAMFSDIKFEEEKELSFKLPKGMMTDKAQFMDFEFNPETGLYSSEHGDGACTRVEEGLVKCDFAYSESYAEIIRMVNPRMEEFLRNEMGIVNEAELKRRLHVLDGFAGDPIGVLYIFQ